jgi:hypothetical protein
MQLCVNEIENEVDRFAVALANRREQASDLPGITIRL